MSINQSRLKNPTELFHVDISRNTEHVKAKAQRSEEKLKHKLHQDDYQKPQAQPRQKPEAPQRHDGQEKTGNVEFSLKGLLKAAAFIAAVGVTESLLSSLRNRAGGAKRRVRRILH